jgi:hypothetical protein
MRQLSSAEVRQYTTPALTDALTQRMVAILKSDIDALLPENPYLLPSTAPLFAGDIVNQALNAHLRIAQEEFIDGLLRDLAIFIAERTCDGRASDQPGVELEFIERGVHYLVSIRPEADKESTKAQGERVEALRRAMTRLSRAAQPVLGNCYGKANTAYVDGCLTVTGPNFWYLISEDLCVYKNITEKVSRETKACRDALAEQEVRANNRMLKQFITRYCDERGAYDWVKFVEHSGCDFDLNAFEPKS